MFFPDLLDDGTYVMSSARLVPIARYSIRDEAYEESIWNLHVEITQGQMYVRRIEMYFPILKSTLRK
jgi:hypothetical protein